MSEISLSSVVRVLHEWQRSKANKELLVTDPATQEEVKASSLVIVKQKYDVQGSIEARYWTLRKSRIPSELKTAYFFSYGGDSPQGTVNVSFKKGFDTTGFLEYLCDTVDELSLTKEKRKQLVSVGNAPMLMTAERSNRFIVFPTYEGKKIGLNETALELIDCVGQYREAATTGISRIQMSLRGQMIPLQTMTTWLENQEKKMHIIKSKVVGANEYELRQMRDKYL